MATTETTEKKSTFRAVGRRKEAIAVVHIAGGKGEIKINKQNIAEYFDTDRSRTAVLEPLVKTGTDKKLDLTAHVRGGGKIAQAEAVRHGLSRALILMNPDFRTVLKKEGFLTRDSRVKERKKYGLKRARKAPQFTKR